MISSSSLVVLIIALLVATCHGAPIASTAMTNGNDSALAISSMPLFIQQKYRQLFASCLRQTNNEACRLIYVVPARKCLPLPSVDAAAGLSMTCSFPIDGINTEQLYIVWTKVSNFFNDKNVRPLQPDRLRSAYADPNFETFVVDDANNAANINNSLQERMFIANFTLEGKAPTTETGPISSPENLPFIFFFSKLKLAYLDLQSDDVLSLSSSLIRRGVELEGARQPPCKRTSLKIPVKWLLNADQRARAIYVYPAEADIGTCSSLATKLGIDSCRLASKDWTRAYDYFRIGLRQELESNPSNKELAEKRRLLGEPSCMPASVSDFEYVVSEVQAKDQLFRYRVVTISKFVVSKCACF